MLVEKGLVEKVPHSGYQVKGVSLDEINELYDVRLALETFVVERLVKQEMAQEAWEDLFNTWNAWLDSEPDPETNLAGCDEAFHEALAQSTGNQTLSRYLSTVNEHLHFIRMYDLTTVERLRETSQQHIQILESIRTKDVVRAREAVRMNIETGRAHVEEALKEALTKAYTDNRKE
jgi:DNA-binding GntR family transcriptional regulator